jgi:PAS domain S-box-containing protein
MSEKKPDKFFNVILNSVADGVFATDNEGKITFINKAAEEITGFSSKEALGHFCFDIFRADICQSRCALKETLKTKKEIIDLPATIIKKGGQKVPISISTAVLKNEDKSLEESKPLGIFLSLRNLKRNSFKNIHSGISSAKIT